MCLASSNANCVRYISSPSRPSAAHRAHERLDVLRHRFLAGDELGAQLGGVCRVRRPSADSQSARSREKSTSSRAPELGIAAAANSLSGGAVPQFRPPATIRAPYASVSCNDLLGFI